MATSTRQHQQQHQGDGAATGSRSLGALLRDLAEGGASLLRHEAQLARLEATRTLATTARATGFAGVGAVLLLLGGLAFLTGLILLAGDQWLRDQFWLAALAVVVIAGAAALLCALRARQHLQPSRLAPEQTVETLREDREWLKRQLTSGATSR